MDVRIEDLGWDSGQSTLSLVRKGGHRDRVAVPPAAGDVSDAMLAERGSRTSGPLFLTRNGRPLYVSWTWRLIKRLAGQANVPQASALTPHSPRATAITELLDAGVPLRDVQDFAGHRDPRTTRRYDKQCGNLDRSGSYLLATRYGRRRDG